MNKGLQFYNYEQCFAHYTKRIMSIRQAKIHGEVILAKPALLLALINGDESGEFTTITPFLKKWQKKEENCYTKRKERYKVTDNQQDPFLLISKQVLLLALIDGIDRLQLRGLEL